MPRLGGCFGGKFSRVGVHAAPLSANWRDAPCAEGVLSCCTHCWPLAAKLGPCWIPASCCDSNPIKHFSITTTVDPMYARSNLFNHKDPAKAPVKDIGYAPSHQQVQTIVEFGVLSHVANSCVSNFRPNQFWSTLCFLFM